MRLSKSDYVLGLKCPNALWFKKFRKDLVPETNQAVFDTGNMVGELACRRFQGGVMINTKPWEPTAITETMTAIKSNAPAIFEATFETPTKEYCAIDILRNNDDGTWDIIEVKSTTGTDDYHFLDASFQKYVCETAGIKIRNVFIMTLNNEYIRHGDLDLEQLFILHDTMGELQDNATVEGEITRLRAFLSAPEIGVAISKAKCNKFYECGYKHHCWANVPPYSVFDAFRGKTADDIYEQHGAHLRKIPTELYGRQMHPGDIECFLNDCEAVDAEGLQCFLGELKYPLYFLDYETIGPAVPMFDNSKPYQAIPFQFSLHIMREPGGKLEHIEYLHDKRTDPRPDLIPALIAACGDNGTVISYNQGFEKSRNTEMGTAFPEYACALASINDRMIDLLIPFRTRALYRPCQNGSASIKQMLPAFVPEMSYANLGIGNGTEASQQFLEFMNGKQTPDQTEIMMKNLREYCGQDTLAMVRLLEVIIGTVNKSEYQNDK